MGWRGEGEEQDEAGLGVWVVMGGLLKEVTFYPEDHQCKGLGLSGLWE